MCLKRVFRVKCASAHPAAHEHAVSRDMGNAEAIPASVNHMNMHRVHAMSDAEITDAHDELRRMFSASSLKFLQTRTATAAESPALTATADPALGMYGIGIWVMNLV